jgi:hypothetical protein
MRARYQTKPIFFRCWRGKFYEEPPQVDRWRKHSWCLFPLLFQELAPTGFDGGFVVLTRIAEAFRPRLLFRFSLATVLHQLGLIP